MVVGQPCSCSEVKSFTLDAFDGPMVMCSFQAGAGGRCATNSVAWVEGINVLLRYPGGGYVAMASSGGMEWGSI